MIHNSKKNMAPAKGLSENSHRCKNEVDPVSRNEKMIALQVKEQKRVKKLNRTRQDLEVMKRCLEREIVNDLIELYTTSAVHSAGTFNHLIINSCLVRPHEDKQGNKRVLGIYRELIIEIAGILCESAFDELRNACLAIEDYKMIDFLILYEEVIGAITDVVCDCAFSTFIKAIVDP
jgi:hypothetical protein